LGQLFDYLGLTRRREPQIRQPLSDLICPVRHGCLSSRIDPGHTIKRGKKVFPGFALLGQYLLSRSG
jgi:hypothetical protein